MTIDSLISKKILSPWKKLVLLTVVPIIIYCSGCLSGTKEISSSISEYFKAQPKVNRDMAQISYRDKGWGGGFPPLEIEHHDKHVPYILIDHYEDGRIVDGTDEDGLIDKVAVLRDDYEYDSFGNKYWSGYYESKLYDNVQDKRESDEFHEYDMRKLEEFTPRFVSLARAAGAYASDVFDDLLSGK